MIRSLKWTILRWQWRGKNSLRRHDKTFSRETNPPFFSFLKFLSLSHDTQTHARHTWGVLRSHEHAPIATQLPLAVSDGSTQTEDGLPLLRLSREFPPVVGDEHIITSPKDNPGIKLRRVPHMSVMKGSGYFWVYEAWSEISETSESSWLFSWKDGDIELQWSVREAKSFVYRRYTPFPDTFWERDLTGRHSSYSCHDKQRKKWSGRVENGQSRMEMLSSLLQDLIYIRMKYIRSNAHELRLLLLLSVNVKY